MSNSINFKSYLPHLTGIVILILIPLIYMSPVFEGKQIAQYDILQYRGGSSEVREYREKTGEEALWNQRMFSGMPSFQAGLYHTSNWMKQMNSFLREVFPHPTGILFVNLFGAYLLLIVLGVNPWLSLGGAIAFGLGTFSMVSIEAGHTSKINALGYVPAILGGIFLVYRRKKLLLGAVLTAFFLALHIATYHLQITYYLLFILLFIGVSELINAIQNNRLNPFLKESGILVIAGLLAIGPNVSKLWTTYEYAKETIRGGKSELTKNVPENSAKSRSGLDWEYAMAWSYGKLETMTLLIPNFVGGNNQMDIGRDSELAEKGIPAQYLKNAPMYWGELPFTSGPIYVGAVITFLFVLGMFLLQGPMRWWMIAFTVLAILLSWGKHFEAFNTFFFNYVPLYNKFRTPSMILLMLSLVFSLGGILGLQRLLSNEKIEFKEVQQKLLIALGITAGLVLLFGVFMAGSYEYSGPSDARLVQAGWPMEALKADRKDLLQSDAFRSLIFIVLTAGLVYAYLKRVINPKLMIAGVVLLITVDLWAVDKRFFGEDSFQDVRKLEARKKPSPADLALNKDPDTHYRVLNIAVSTFNDAITSFHHRSIGGYHAAKILRYQELIENHINPSIQQLKGILSSEPTKAKIDRALQNMPVLNMLNAKYIIYNPEAQPLTNQSALGNAWFVEQVNYLESADEVMRAVGSFNPAKEMLARSKDKSVFQIDNHRYDPQAKIELTNYNPNKMVYSASVSENASEQWAVFSEIYYEGGNNDWKVTIDGNPVEIGRVNYVLRGIKVPPGNHEIVFHFAPRSYYLGSTISMVFSILIILLLIFGIWQEVKKGGVEAAEEKAA